MQLTIWIVPYHRGGRDVGSEDAEAGYGGEARLEERPTGKRNQGEGFPDLHRRGDGSRCREITSELRGAGDKCEAGRESMHARPTEL